MPKVPLEDYQPVKTGTRHSHEGDAGPLGGTVPSWAPYMPLKYRLAVIVIVLALLILNRDYTQIAAGLFIIGTLMAVAWRFISRVRRNEKS